LRDEELPCLTPDALDAGRGGSRPSPESVRDAGPDVHPRQISAPLSKRERIALCESKRGVPVDPADPKPLEVEGKVTRPRPIYQPKPGSPLSTPRGNIVLEGIIDEDGCVRQLKVLKSTDEGLSSAALKSIGQWVFQPATLDGRPVRVSYVVTFSFAP
jgi:TonB family protein